MNHLDTIIEDLRKKQMAYVEVTVVRRIRPSSANVGDRAVVTEQGEMFGFVGGQCTRSLVVGQAQECLRRGEPRLLLVTAHPPNHSEEGVTVLPMSCQSEGTVELFVEPHLPRPVLAVIGDSPIAEALMAYAGAFGFHPLQAVLGTAKQHDRGLGDGKRVSADLPIDPIEELQALWQSEGKTANRVCPSYAVVATMGLYDVDGVLALSMDEKVNLTLRYLGIVTSPRRWAVLKQELIASGVSETFLQKVSAPAGFDIGAVGPEEIALSILAQLIQVRRQGRLSDDDVRVGSVRTQVAQQTTPHSEGELQADADCLRGQCCSERTDAQWAETSCCATESPVKDGVNVSNRAVDPVCGMTVDLTRTKHTTVHDGVIYGFCCAGCKTKFREHPGQYIKSSGTCSSTKEENHAHL